MMVVSADSVAEGQASIAEAQSVIWMTSFVAEAAAAVISVLDPVSCQIEILGAAYRNILWNSHGEDNEVDLMQVCQVLEACRRSSR